jgi:hypothetical protein
MNKRQILLFFGGISYVIILGSVIPILIINLNLFGSIYDYFAVLARDGLFFLLYLISTFFFFPFIYSTLVKGKLSFNVDVNKKKKTEESPILCIDIVSNWITNYGLVISRVFRILLRD